MQTTKHYIHIFPSKMNFHLMYTFIGSMATMHYNSYVPDLDLKPVQFLFNHQVSILIIHIPNAETTNGVCYISTDQRVMGCNNMRPTDSTP